MEVSVPLKTMWVSPPCTNVLQMNKINSPPKKEVTTPRTPDPNPVRHTHTHCLRWASTPSPSTKGPSSYLINVPVMGPNLIKPATLIKWPYKRSNSVTSQGSNLKNLFTSAKNVKIIFWPLCAYEMICKTHDPTWQTNRWTDRWTDRLVNGRRCLQYHSGLRGRGVKNKPLNVLPRLRLQVRQDNTPGRWCQQHTQPWLVSQINHQPSDCACRSVLFSARNFSISWTRFSSFPIITINQKKYRHLNAKMW